MCCFSGTTITHGASRRGGDSPAMNHTRCQQARWRLPCIATKASTVLTQLYCKHTIAHTIVQLPCIATEAIIMPCSCPAAQQGHHHAISCQHHAMLLPCSCPATQQGHDCFCWAKGRKAPLDRPSCCNFRKRTRKSCRHNSVISWSLLLTLGRGSPRPDG
jgi:hypothetical protein